MKSLLCRFDLSWYLCARSLCLPACLSLVFGCNIAVVVQGSDRLVCVVVVVVAVVESSASTRCKVFSQSIYFSGKEKNTRTRELISPLVLAGRLWLAFHCRAGCCLSARWLARSATSLARRCCVSERASERAHGRTDRRAQLDESQPDTNAYTHAPHKASGRRIAQCQTAVALH